MHQDILLSPSCAQGMKEKNNMENHVYMRIVPGAVRFFILNHCIHGNDEHQFGNMSVEMQSFRYVTYQSNSVKESKKIALVKS